MSDNTQISVVTGAFGFSGRYITRRLLAAGQRVRTLTMHARPNTERDAPVEVAPQDFSQPAELARSLQCAKALYNTYWVRFAHGSLDHDRAVANSTILIRAAEQAGVERLVHVSITNPSLDSPLPYFRGKAEVEEAIKASRLSYAILRPAVLFGDEDILINNIAWLLRRFPVFAVPGKGDYGLQPIFVDDLAALATAAGEQRENAIIDAVGPETYSYEDLVRMIAVVIGSRANIVHLSPRWVLLASKMLGMVVNDVVLTRDEIDGLMANLLVSKNPPTGTSSLRAWVEAHKDTIGTKYASELARHFR